MKLSKSLTYGKLVEIGVIPSHLSKPIIIALNGETIFKFQFMVNGMDGGTFDVLSRTPLKGIVGDFFHGCRSADEADARCYLYLLDNKKILGGCDE